MPTDSLDQVYAVIMAGGSGTRLWPISRQRHPKHTLPLLGQETLFQSTLARLAGLLPPERTLIVTNAGQAPELMKQAPSLPAENFLLEPQPRGTAPAVGLAAIAIQARTPQAVMLVLPSDHYIHNQQQFQVLMRVGVQVAWQGSLVTIGIHPTFPSTGYGYIQQGAPLPASFDHPVFQVRRFTEKPDEATARAMLAGGDHSWNSGMFIWRVDRILNEIGQHMPALAACLSSLENSWQSPGRNEVLHRAWQPLATSMIDYGVMEHARDVAVLPAGDLEWSDVGSWDSLFDVLPADQQGNMVINGDLIPLETRSSLVYSSKKKLVVTIGVDNLIIIDAGDALLVCRRDHSQQVRKVIDLLKTNKQEYL